ncbi:ATP-binding cassette domain-containing protein, partial [Bacillus toyonensis]|uniref:ATP-binding cassette domain-containing protein n=1 Tax=Bacillus toyonensis TaxID=155322 RepID=UPI002FFE45F2
MTLAIEMKDVMKSFNEKTALRNVNIEVKQGEIFGFLGPSGSGKTTTVKILTSQLLHSVGTVRVLFQHYEVIEKLIFLLLLFYQIHSVRG